MVEQYPIIQEGDTGESVKKWQHILITEGFSLYPYGADGSFGKLTTTKTKEYQRKHNLVVDGMVGIRTWMSFYLNTDGNDTSYQEPPLPNFPQLKSQAELDNIFGKFQYVSASNSYNPEAIKILGDWVKNNIVYVEIPQLKNVQGALPSCKVAFHRLAKDQFVGLWDAWDKAGLINRVLTWDGSWVPRFIRGSRTILSNHSRASAFDINVQYNWMGSAPADFGRKGCVKELIALAHQFGFFWGGHFTTRIDPMHFEVAKIL